MSGTWIILQARMGSSRLPGKALAPLAGEPMLGVIVKRLGASELADGVCVATTDLAEDDPIQDYCAGHLGCACFRGSSEDVLGRYAACAEMLGADAIVRATGDNPLADPAIVDAAIRRFRMPGVDYVRYREGLPLGLGVEVLGRHALKRADVEASDPECREHVTPYLYRNPDIFSCLKCPREGEDYSRIRLTVDTPEDFITIRSLLEAEDADPSSFGWRDAVRVAGSHAELIRNASVVQNRVGYAGEGGARGR